MSNLSENDIRPEELMKKKEASLEWDKQFIADRVSQFVPVKCPACGGEGEKTFEKFCMSYDLCSDCQTVYVSPRPSEDLLAEFYSKSKNYDFWNKWIFPASEEARREKIFKPRLQMTLDLIEKYELPVRSLLEVGAGFGLFCEEAQKSGFFDRVVALEPTPSLAETCRKRGLETIESPIEKLDPDFRIDGIVSFEVIEHLFSPLSFLKQCANYLSSKGLLVISCPNIQGFDIECLGTLSNVIDHEHLNYFNPSSIEKIMNEAGFKVISVETPGKLDADIVRDRALKGMISLDDQPFLKRVLLDDWGRLGSSFQRFLSDNKLSSHMVCVAQKI